MADPVRTVGSGISTGSPVGALRQTSPHSASSEQHSEHTAPARTGQSAMSGSSYAVSQEAQRWVADGGGAALPGRYGGGEAVNSR
ncbi:hypothetical protein KN815_18925 [Streptomyces sp. 4503]|uniref:Uncharacterized protein n=1 Tax=Streptomyces niphimycinicus TaxID=2842201 RepID=A0ABS6CGM0_9ACTN|nr:hypothetical protein [Streptomyces niphimycinicus]